MDWLLRNIPLLLYCGFSLAMLWIILRASVRSQKRGAENADDPRRLEEIRTRLRQLAEARRHSPVSEEAVHSGPTARTPAPVKGALPPLRPGVPPIDPFGGGRWSRKLGDVVRRVMGKSRQVSARNKNADTTKPEAGSVPKKQ